LAYFANNDSDGQFLVVGYGDAVYEAGEDARLFVAEGAEPLLRDRTIDALRDDAGRVQFVLVTQPATRVTPPELSVRPSRSFDEHGQRNFRVSSAVSDAACRCG